MNIESHSVPRAVAAAAPAAPTAVGRALKAAWDVLAQVGAHQARAELLRLATTCETTRPELSAQLRRAARDGWL